MWNRLSTLERVIAAAAAITFIAAFLPWASVLGISAQGVDGDGVITLVLALIGVVLLAFARGRRGSIAQVVLGAVVALTGIVDLSSVAAIGLYLTLIAGIVWTGAAIALVRAPRVPERAD